MSTACNEYVLCCVVEQSGYINSITELEQLTVAALVKLQLRKHSGQLDQQINNAFPDLTTVDWSLERYANWFKTEFLTKVHCPPPRIFTDSDVACNILAVKAANLKLLHRVYLSGQTSDSTDFIFAEGNRIWPESISPIEWDYSTPGSLMEEILGTMLAELGAPNEPEYIKYITAMQGYMFDAVVPVLFGLFKDHFDPDSVIPIQSVVLEQLKSNISRIFTKYSGSQQLISPLSQRRLARLQDLCRIFKVESSPIADTVQTNSLCEESHSDWRAGTALQQKLFESGWWSFVSALAAHIGISDIQNMLGVGTYLITRMLILRKIPGTGRDSREVVQSMNVFLTEHATALESSLALNLLRAARLMIYLDEGTGDAEDRVRQELNWDLFNRNLPPDKLCPNHRTLVWCQNKLLDLKIASAIVSFMAHPEDRIVEAVCRLAITVLDGNCTESQNMSGTAIASQQKSAHLPNEKGQCMLLAELKTSDNHRFFEVVSQKIKNAAPPILEYKPQPDCAQANVCELILQFLSLCMDGGQKDFQNLLRQQENTSVSVNLLLEVRNLLVRVEANIRVEKGKNVSSQDMIIHVFEFFAVAMKGPCEANQLYVASSDVLSLMLKIFDTLKRCNYTPEDMLETDFLQKNLEVQLSGYAMARLVFEGVANSEIPKFGIPRSIIIHVIILHL